MRGSTLIVLGLAAALSPIALGQADEAAAAAKAKAIEVLRAADEALNAVEFTARVYGVGAMAGTTPSFLGEVVMARGGTDDPIGFHMHVEGRFESPTESRDVMAAYDGSRARTVRASESKVVTTDAGQAATALADAGIVYHWTNWWSKGIAAQLAEDAELLPVRAFGETVIEGVRCAVVHVDCSNLPNFKDEYDLWWAFGVEDHLPRRLEASYYVGDLLGLVVLEFDAIKATPAPPAETFALAVPPGMKEEVLTKARPAGPTRAAAPTGPKAGEAAPDWTLPDPTGAEVTLASLKGKIVVMDFWATWCGPCKAAMPGMQALHTRFKDRGVVVIGVNCWESGDAAAYMEKNQLTYPLVLKGDEVARAYAVTGIPTFYVIDEDGKVLERRVGFNPKGEEELGKLIEARLAAIGK